MCAPFARRNRDAIGGILHALEGIDGGICKDELNELGMAGTSQVVEADVQPPRVVEGNGNGNGRTRVQRQQL